MPSSTWLRIDPGLEVGRRLYGYREVTSTMDVAWEQVGQGATHGTAFVADVQTQGRGRFRRAWVSGPGESLLMSVILRPPADVAPYLSIIGPVGIRSAVQDVTGIRCDIKWPNDLEVQGRKLCGTLVEARTSTSTETIAILGIGLNLNLDAASHSGLSNATSLHVVAGRTFAVVDMAVSVLTHLDAWYTRAERGADVIAEWRSTLTTLGKRVTVVQRNGQLEGLAEDVDDVGRLLVRAPDGTLHVVAEGDVTLRN